MNNYSVYIHTAPNNKVYVGITCRKPEYRWAGGNGYKNNKHFFQAILKYGWDNIRHDIIATNLSKSDAEKMERKLIAQFQSDNREYGYNVLKGGTVVNGGWHHTEESRKKIGEGAKGRKRSQKNLEAVSAARSKKIKQYDINGNFIREYKSIMESERETGVSNSNITGCCKGKYNSMQGYIFRYSDDNRPVKPYRGKRRRVCQYTTDGEYVRTYSSTAEAAKEIKVHRNHITNVCKFKTISSGGFLWLYENETERLKEKVDQYKAKRK